MGRGGLCKSLLIAGLVFSLVYILLSSYPCCQSSSHLLSSFSKGWNSYAHGSSAIQPTTPTDISHIVFGIAGSASTWRSRRNYIEAWWRPNVTRGYVWLERFPTDYFPWSPSSPPFRVSEDTGRFKDYDRHGMRFAIRMVRVILETFREDHEDVRWYVMADDDTVLVIDNLVKLLSTYDHNNYLYIGHSSECTSANALNSYEMAFGGAGYALSYPLAKAVVSHLDECVKRYPTLFGSDHILQSCISELGISLTHERGFHQIDLRGDISGFLSAHPQVPFISLHHLDVVEPIFPSMDRYQSLRHLMKAAEADSSRLLQQTICYDKNNSWSLSISWGYSAHIYERIQYPSILQMPIETFKPFSSWARPAFVFNTRPPSRHPCEAPHVFFFQSVVPASATEFLTTYTRRSPRWLPPCSSNGNHSADRISEVRVFSSAKRLDWIGTRRECCDFVGNSGMNVSEVRIRTCMENEGLT